MSSEQDLTSILSVEERSELTVLVATCAESIRTIHSKAFSGTELTDDERSLLDATLTSFNEWKLAILTRLGEVLNQKSPPKTLDPSTAENVPETSTFGQFAIPETPLSKLDFDVKKTILSSLLLLSLSLPSHNYDPRSRTMLHILSSSLRLPRPLLLTLENEVAKILVSAAMKADEEESRKRNEASSTSRKWKMGIAGVAGGILVGVTGGLAAPLVAAGLGSLFGAIGLGSTIAATYLGALASSSVLVGALFGGYGAKMSSDMMDRYSKEVNDFDFLPLHMAVDSSDARRLSVRIGVTGWLSDGDVSPATPWEIFDDSADCYVLRWEVEALKKLGGAMREMVVSSAIGYAKKEVIRRTFLAGIWTALVVPVGMLKVGRIVDNPWRIGMVRAQKAGDVLADALINKAQGERPVTLLAYSLGSRLVHQTLLKLAEKRAFNIVENVIFIGSPLPAQNSTSWRAIRSVVSGRVANCYAQDDWVLGFVYRGGSLEWGVAGLEEINCIPGVENYDVSSLVSGHLQYRFVLGEILEEVGTYGLDEKTIAARAKEGEEEEEALEAQEKGDINDEKITAELEKIHIDEKLDT